MIDMGVSVGIASIRSPTTTDAYPAFIFIMGPSLIMELSRVWLPTNSSREMPGYTTKAIVFFAIFSLSSRCLQVRFCEQQTSRLEDLDGALRLFHPASVFHEV